MEDNVRFIDTSVLLRLLLRDNEEKAERALMLLLSVERGEARLATSHLVIFETIFTLQRHNVVTESTASVSAISYGRSSTCATCTWSTSPSSDVLSTCT